MSEARYVMIGGFLGAGKTTAILQLARRLRDQGLRVGLITNDQSVGLVDTAMLESHGFDVAEITGGCFCCKFNSLVDAADRLSAHERPDVFLAEPVGSCTDLKATVDYPLRRMYRDAYAIAPLSVLVDPIRAMRILGLANGNAFSPKVQYIYAKQLEEADLIVVNKTDLISGEQLEALKRALGERFGRAKVLAVSARTGDGIDAWLDALASSPARTAGAIDVDYATYGQGEALLGWLNCTVSLHGEADFDGNAALLTLADAIRARLNSLGAEIAHLKMTLTAEEGNDIAVVNLVRTDGHSEPSHKLAEPLRQGQLILNLRAEADPEILRREVTDAIASFGGTGEAASAGRPVSARIDHLESFRPGQPTPVHRLAGV